MAQLGIKRALHVGDFAIGFQNNRQYTKPLNHLCEQLGVKLYITPGNHENYDYIEQLPVLTEGEDAGWQQLGTNLLVAPRGLRWMWAGVSFVSLGGGNSIDYQARTLGRDWWAQEAITRRDLEVIEAGGKADVMIAHVAPFEAVYELDSLGWNETAVRYSDESRLVMGMAVEAVQPKLFLHGHYHIDKRQTRHQHSAFSGEHYATEYVSLGMNGHVNNMATLQLPGLATEFIAWP